MAKAISPGYTDTALEGVGSISTPYAVLNLAADFRQLPQVNADDVQVTNLTSPTDQPEVFRFASTTRKDIYAGTDIEPAAKLTSTSGTRYLLELRQVHAITDTSDATYRKLVPVRIAITLDIPKDIMWTHVQTLSLVKRGVAMFFNQGVNDSSRLNDLLHGLLRPKAVSA